MDIFVNQSQYKIFNEICNTFGKKIKERRPDIIYLFITSDYSMFAVSRPDKRASYRKYDPKKLYIEKVAVLEMSSADLTICKMNHKLAFVTHYFDRIELDINEDYQSAELHIEEILHKYFSQKHEMAIKNASEENLSPFRKRLSDSESAFDLPSLATYANAIENQLGDLPVFGMKLNEGGRDL